MSNGGEHVPVNPGGGRKGGRVGGTGQIEKLPMPAKNAFQLITQILPHFEAVF